MWAGSAVGWGAWVPRRPPNWSTWGPRLRRRPSRCPPPRPPPLAPDPLILASLLDVHAAWAWVLIISNGLSGLWALGPHRWPAFRTRALWWFTVFPDLSVFVQAGLALGLLPGPTLNAP